MGLANIYLWKMSSDAGGPLLIVLFGCVWGMFFWIVAAIVEALTLYLFLRPSVLRALELSLLANLISSIIGFFGCLGFAVIRFPLSHAAELLWFWLVLGIVSIVIEAPVWILGLQSASRHLPKDRIVGMCILANLLGYIVIGILIWYLFQSLGIST